MNLIFLSSKNYENYENNCGDCVIIDTGEKAIIYDCGCEEQKIDDHSFKFCDANNKGAGWDINGKYYYKGEDDKYHEDSSKDIKFEK